MEFNPDPIKQATEVLFSCKISGPNHPQLIFNGIAVAKVNDQKHLGLDTRFEIILRKKDRRLKRMLGYLNSSRNSYP